MKLSLSVLIFVQETYYVQDGFITSSFMLTIHLETFPRSKNSKKRNEVRKRGQGLPNCMFMAIKFELIFIPFYSMNVSYFSDCRDPKESNNLEITHERREVGALRLFYEGCTCTRKTF